MPSNEVHQCKCGKKCKTWNGLAKHLAKMKFIEDAGWCPKGHHIPSTLMVDGTVYPHPGEPQPNPRRSRST